MKHYFGTTFLMLLLISIGLTTIGYWLDSDLHDSLSTTMFEFAMMTIILFLIVSGIYFGTMFTYKKVKQLLS
jgi:uncharacterized membrane protein